MSDIQNPVRVANWPKEICLKGQCGNKATVTAVAVNPNTHVVILSENKERIKAIVFNAGGTLYVKLGEGAAEDSFTYRLTANTEKEITGYTGPITAIKASGSSTAYVTEVTL